MPSCAGDFLDAGHGVVEVAGDLHRQRPVVEGLRELAVGDLARADEDHGLHQPGDRAVQGQRGAGVAGRGAGRPAGADRVGVREGGRHAVVFEAARGVHALVLQVQVARLECRRTWPTPADGCKSVCPSPIVTTCSTRRKGQQLVEPPHAAERQWVVAAGPFLLEELERVGRRSAVPVVNHVQQAAADVAGQPRLLDGVGCAASRRDAPLKGDVGQRGDANGSWLPKCPHRGDCTDSSHNPHRLCAWDRHNCQSNCQSFCGNIMPACTPRIRSRSLCRRQQQCLVPANRGVTPSRAGKYSLACISARRLGRRSRIDRSTCRI